MLKNIYDKLEDPYRPLLGPNVKALKFWGLLLPKNKTMKYIYIFLHLSIIYFTATEYVDIWFIKSDINMLLENLKITMLATMSVIKVTTFLMFQRDWVSIMDYVTKADLNQRNTEDDTNKSIIKNFTRYCRKITYCYWFLMYTTVVIVMLQPVIKYAFFQTYRENVKSGNQAYMQVVSSWLPFDKNTTPGCIAAYLFQSYAAIYGGGWITSFDTNAIVIMIFFRVELELLKRDSASIFGAANGLVPEKEAKRRLKECYKRHVDLVRYSRLFDSCLSPIMMFYVFVCSVMLCVTSYQITSETNVMQMLLQVEYLVFGVSQLFLYCWHSNDVFHISQELVRGPFESVWWKSSILRKDLAILMAQFSTNIVFSAGPFAKLSVPTFINILKGAYSYYTLLNQSQVEKKL
ncbi:odorant receptor 10-like [Choristoneura fumiferana]|uniref:odorant receptor 10-like n=1 Tax=Choristoneura fumiferana TaxID=7141 RepID=UPI003D15657A